MSNFIIGLLVGGMVGWFLCHGYVHLMIATECERLGGFFVGEKVFKCVAVVDHKVEQGTPNAILEAATKRKFEHEVSECRHWSTAMWADGKAECFGCGATVNNKREVLEVERK